jgi:uncharacterized protein (TIGR03382 family)
MAFSNTLCFDTRVNFNPGHLEYASLYEATDKNGKVYSVMVPFVCGNVSLLLERTRPPDLVVPIPGTATLVLLALGLAVAARRRRLRSEAMKRNVVPGTAPVTQAARH